MQNHNLERFINPSDKFYDVALLEIKRGKKKGHWIWYIFPQLKGLGTSSTSEIYGINNLEEAIEYINHPIKINFSITLIFPKFIPLIYERYFKKPKKP